MDTTFSRQVILSLVTVTLLLGSAARADESQRVEARPSGAGFASVDVAGWDVTGLNAVLASHGTARVSSFAWGFGGEGYWFNHRLVLGGEGHSLSGASADGVTTLSGGYGFAKVGYALVRRDFCRLYPLVGFGGGWLGLNDKDDSSGASAFMLQAALRFDLWTASHGLVLGAQVGVNGAPAPGYLHVGGGTIALRAFDSVFGGLSVGFGG